MGRNCSEHGLLNVVAGRGLDLCHVAAISVDAQMHASPLNGLARSLLESPTGLRLHNHRLQAERAADHRRLQSTVHDALHDEGGRPVPITLQRKAGDRPLCGLLVAGALPDGGNTPRNNARASPAAGERSLLLLIADPDWVAIPSPDYLVTWFNLTPREAAVAAGIGAGHCVMETANELAISAGTVRTHLKHIYMKLNVSSATQLIALLRTIAFGRRIEPGHPSTGD